MGGLCGIIHTNCRWLFFYYYVFSLSRKECDFNLKILDLPQQNQLLYAGLSQTKIADFLLHATTISIFSC
jgi:hypothetical protein